VDLRDLGARLHLFSASGEDLGFVHVPLPLEVGDVVTLGSGSLWRVSTLVVVGVDSDVLDALAQVEPCA
jgi:hypothetical protein